MYDASTGHEPVREYRVEARRTADGTADQRGTGRWWLSWPTGARLSDTALAPDPVELLLTSVAAALLAGAEASAALLDIAVAAVEVHVYAVLRSNQAACPITVEYDLTLESNEPEARLVQLHEELRHGSPVLKLVAAGTLLNGRMHPRHV